jgi:hypothetical protein
LRNRPLSLLLSLLVQLFHVGVDLRLRDGRGVSGLYTQTIVALTPL